MPEPKYKVWTCDIVIPGDIKLPDGADGPPRWAAILAVKQLGAPVRACFSGWGGTLTPRQRECVDEWEAERQAREQEETT